jgi:hypothetical protein
MVGHGPFKHSDSVSVLQYGTGLSSDFLIRILDVDTPVFLCNTQVYFPRSSLLVHKSHKSRHTYVVCDRSVLIF